VLLICGSASFFFFFFTFYGIQFIYDWSFYAENVQTNKDRLDFQYKNTSTGWPYFCFSLSFFFTSQKNKQPITMFFMNQQRDLSEKKVNVNSVAKIGYAM